MKVKVGNYDIDIKVKNTLFSDRNNLMDTISFLNEVSLAFGHAAEEFEASKRSAIAEDFNNKSNDIYQALKAVGAYKDI